ncbi:hypothetical protein SAMN04488103_1185 [Gemmobacter aquatilis]|uniref:Antifreeze glycopeptide polyprotein n=1 Tax=Gemmobacter aquatilis TaxID=933059 RepID=A0A1H8NB17_9RHOB|nr:hypothetical protein [Gemmobacter aquatilis]SEO26708.1 hypothetical protein SAMN04488103_1185 [Gemmobacter aquatilis]
MQTDYRRRFPLSALSLLACLCGTGAAADEPLSAIDWLSKSVAVPAAAPSLGPVPSSTPNPAPKTDEPAVTKGALPGAVTVTVLGAPSLDGVGLLPAARTGLPRALWGLSKTEDIALRLTREQTDTLPALQGLLITLLLAEADPPVDSGGRGLLLLARIDKLLSMGALDQAAALTEIAGNASPELFRRRFDIALLTGQEDLACAEMQSAPHLAPTLTARIFCLARAGDWNAAALTLESAQALQQVPAEQEALLERFLDPELADGAEPLPPPALPTPLIWRMYEAIGEPLATAHLPLAFAHAELRPQSGWKAQIEAAERLARAGAITPNLLLGIYTDRQPAASGGVWDRVAAFQDFDAAVTSGDREAVLRTLEPAWDAMRAVELENAFAALFGERLAAMELPDAQGVLALRMALLSPQYEHAARSHLANGPADNPQEAFLLGLAQGNIQGLIPPDSMARAVAPAFLTPVTTDEAQLLLAEHRIGEALMLAIDGVARGVQGDPRGVAEGLSLLRKLGLEDIARRTALELLLLERRG